MTYFPYKKILDCDLNKPCMLLTIALCVFASNIRANAQPLQASLKLKPNQCVAMHQGQKCYVDLDISWSVNIQGSYCLFESTKVLPLQCWDNSNKGKFSQEIILNENVTFHLKQQSTERVIADAEIELAWIYKKDSRAHLSWRMF